MTAKAPNTELIDYQFKVMNERLEAHQEYTKNEFQWLRKDMKDGNQAIHDKLDKFIDMATKTFATKQDHEDNSARISELEKNRNNVIRWIFWIALGIILVTLWLDKYIL